MASKLRKTRSGNAKPDVDDCSDAPRQALSDEMVEEDTEPGEDEGEFSGDGETALGCFVRIRSSEGCSLLVEKLKLWPVLATEGTWNIEAERRPQSRTVDAGAGVYTYADIRKLTAYWALQ